MSNPFWERVKKQQESSDFITSFDSLDDKTKKRLKAYYEKKGWISPRDNGFFSELSDSVKQTTVSGLSGVSNTLGLVNGKAYFDKVLANNQQWSAPNNPSAMSYVGRAIGSAVGSTALLAPATVAGAALAGPLGGGATAAAVLGGAGTLSGSVLMDYGDRVDDYNERFKDMYSEDQIKGIAFLGSFLNGSVEAGLGIMPGVGKLAGKTLSATSG